MFEARVASVARARARSECLRCRCCSRTMTWCDWDIALRVELMNRQRVPATVNFVSLGVHTRGDARSCHDWQTSR